MEGAYHRNAEATRCMQSGFLFHLAGLIKAERIKARSCRVFLRSTETLSSAGVRAPNTSVPLSDRRLIAPERIQNHLESGGLLPTFWVINVQARKGFRPLPQYLFKRATLDVFMNVRIGKLR